MKTLRFFRLFFVYFFIFTTFIYTNIITAEDEGGVPVLVQSIADQTAVENTAFSLNIAGNFSGGGEGNPLTYSASGLTPNLNISSEGSISGFVLTGDIGAHIITVTATDTSTTLFATGSFTLNVISTSTLHAVDDQVSGIVEDSLSNLIDVLSNDVGGGSLQSLGVPDNGGSVAINAGQVEYTPSANFAGDEAFSYTIGNGSETSTAQATVSVLNVNDAPVVSSPIGNQNATEAVAYSIDLNNHFSDVDSEDQLFFDVSGLPVSFLVNEAGVLSGVATAGDIGVHSITVTAIDSAEASADDTFTLTIIANTDDLAQDDNFNNIAEDSVANVLNVLANDLGGGLTITSVSPASQGGSVQIVGNNIEYTPVADFAGQETFTYEVINTASVTDSAIVTIGVTNVNDAPVLAIIPTQSATESVAFSLDIADYISDVDDSVHLVTATGLPDSLTISTEGLITGTPRFEDVGSMLISVTVTDRRQASVTQSFTLNVAENTALVAKDDYYTFTENTVANVLDVLANDQGSSMTITSVSAPSPGGSAVIVAGTTIEYTPAANFFGDENLTYTIDSDGTSYTATIHIKVLNSDSAPILATPIADVTGHSVGVTFELNINSNFIEPDGQLLSFTMAGAPASLSINNGIISGSPVLAEVGSYVITITASDIKGNSLASSFNMTIIDDQSQLARDDLFDNIVKDSSNNILDVLANDITPAGSSLTITSVSTPTQGGVVSISAGSSLLYTPATGFEGSETFTYTFFVIPGFQQFSANVTVKIPVPVPVNQPPQLSTPIPSQVKNENDNYQLNLNDHFTDENSNQIIYQVTGLPGGINIDSGSGVISGGAQTDANAGVYTINVTATDAFALSSNTTFQLTVIAQNDAPYYSAFEPLDSLQLTEDIAFSFDLSSRFDDEEDATLTFSASGLPASLTMTTAGLLSGTPLNADVGSYNVILTVSDSGGASVTQSFQLVVINVNDAPVFTSSPITSVNVGAAYSYTFLATDVDGDTLNYVVTGLPAWLTYNVATNTLSGTPAITDIGTSNIVIQASDGQSTTEQAYQLQVQSGTLADLAVSLTVKSPSHRAGNKANLKAVINNLGPDDARDVVFTVQVSASMTIKGPGFCSVSSTASFKVLTCNYAEIRNSKKKNINFTVESDDAGEFSVVANVSSIDDSIFSNNSATVNLVFTNANLNGSLIPFSSIKDVSKTKLDYRF